MNTYEKKPIPKPVENILFKPSDTAIHLTYPIDNVKYGVMKNGIKPTYKNWKRGKTTFAPTMPFKEPVFSEEEEAKPEESTEPEESAEPEKPEVKVPEVDKAALKEQFEAFAKFGDKAADGKTIKLSQSDKWFKQVSISTKFHEQLFHQ